jgi:hypothetical protein
MAHSLIAIVSCHARDEQRWAIRNTWLPLVPKDTRVAFFSGRGIETRTKGVYTDEVFLDCDDSYQGLPEKVQCIVKWALENGYDHVLKLDDDVVVNPEQLLASGYDEHPYVGTDGHRPCPPTRPFFIASGFAYWMDKQCMELVANATLPPNNYDEGWVAGILYEHGIALHADQRYYISVCRSLPGVDKRRIGTRQAPRIRKEPVPGTFAWCIYLEPNGGTKYSTEAKIEEFKRVFAIEVNAKK